MKQKGRKMLAMDGVDFECHVIDGCEYMIPASSDYALHEFGELLVGIGKDAELQTASEERLLIPFDQSTLQLKYRIGLLERRPLSASKYPVIVALYRKGMSLPVVCRHYDDEGDICTGYIPKSKLCPGEYYLYIGNAEPVSDCPARLLPFGKGYVYRFVLLENGLRKELPGIVSGVVDNDLSFHLTLKDRVSMGTDWLTCECFDESYRTVARSHRMVVSDDGLSVILDMRPEGWWLDGEYHVLVYHNGLPKRHFSFCWEGFMAKATVQEALTPESAFYQLYRIVHKREGGDEFGLLPGCRAVKKQTLRYWSQHFTILASPHVVQSRYELDERAMRLLFQILYPRRTYLSVSCLEMAQKLFRHEDVTEVLKAFDRQSVILLYDLLGLLSPECGFFAEHVLHHVSFMDCVVVLHGTEEELSAVMEHQPEWKRVVMKQCIWTLEPYTLTERVRVVEHCLATHGMTASYPARAKIHETLRMNEGRMVHWRKAELERWVRDHVIANQRNRVLNGRDYRVEILRTIEAEDVETGSIQ